MSQQMVESVIDELLRDEDLRIRFIVDRMETLAELSLRGLELSGNEIELLCQTNPRLWFCGRAGELKH